MTAAETAKRPPLWRLVWEEVRQDRIPLRASALAFQTLASWLPLLAIVLAILSGPAFESQREEVLDRLATALIPAASSDDGMPGWFARTLSPAQEQNPQARFKERFRARLLHLSGNLAQISALSFLTLLLIAGLLYRTAEEAFNEIWKVRAGRSLFMKLAIITVFIFWGPVLIFVSISLTKSLSGAVAAAGYILPVLLTSAAFTAFYMIMPNAKVQFKAALIGGVFGAVLWELGKAGFLLYVAYAVGISKMYGSLGLVPMIFAWVYLSWIMILAGGKLTYIVQHHKVIVEQWEARQRLAGGLTGLVDEAQREAELLPALALAGAAEIVRRFQAGAAGGGSRLSELAEALEVETGPLGRALDRLVEGGVFVRVAEENSGTGADSRYLPASHPGSVRLDQVLRACRGEPPEFGEGASWEQARKIMARWECEGEKPLANLTLLDLAPPPTPAPPAKPAGEVAPSAPPAAPQGKTGPSPAG